MRSIIVEVSVYFELKSLIILAKICERENDTKFKKDLVAACHQI